MEPISLRTADDVQARAPRVARRPLARRRHGRREGHPHRRRPGAEQLFFGALECFVDLGPRQKGAHMSRFEEVVNEAIGEVVLGEARFKAETLAQHIAELVRERQGAARAEVTIAARYPEHKPAPGLRHPDAGDLHAATARAVASAQRHAAARRRRRAGHDRVPVRAGARRRHARASGCGDDGLRRRRDRADLRGRPRRHAQPARPRHAAHRLPRGLRRPRSRRATLLDDRRGLDVLARSTS